MPLLDQESWENKAVTSSSYHYNDHLLNAFYELSTSKILPHLNVTATYKVGFSQSLVKLSLTQGKW